MGVTQVSAAELAKKKRTRFPVIGVEIGWLIVASLFVGIGLMKVYQAKLSAVADVDEQLKNKQILNLNSLSSHDELLPYLEVFPNLNDRQFAARKIYEYIIGTGSGSVNRRALANVGELVKIRITKEELDAKPQLEDLRKRLAQTNDQRSINLLTLSQLARIKPILVVRSNNEFRQSFWKYGLIYFAGFYLVSFIWLWRSIRVDRFLLPAVHLVTGVGLMLMLSLRDPLRDMMIYNDFSIGVATGFVLMLLASLVNYERVTLKNLSWVPLAFSFVLAFVLLLVGSGPSGSDAKVNLGPFQPVEFIKILLVLFLAGYFAERWEYLRNLKERSSHFAGLLNRLNIPRLKYTLPVFIGMAIALVFFFLQKDMGPALVMAVLFLTLYCVARKRPLMAILGIAVMVSGFYAGYRLGAPKTVVNRVNMWLSPWNNVARGGDQLAQSMWGLASGGGTGAGLGIGDPSVMPAAHTDLIISTVGEEMGFLGMLLVLGLYALLVYRCLRICMNATGEYSFFLGLGLTTLIAFEIILIAGGILGILPLSGIVNPFLSYGKTSMWANLLIIGILVSISAHSGAIVKEQSIATVPFARPVKVLTWGLSAVAVLFVVCVINITPDCWQLPDRLPEARFMIAMEFLWRPVTGRNWKPIANGTWNWE
jgi:cell division protein FtsW (lipid II flippase)